MTRSSFSAVTLPGRWARLIFPAAALAAGAALSLLPVPAWGWVALRLFLQM